MSTAPESDEPIDMLSSEAIEGAVEGVIEAVGSEAVAVGVSIKTLRKCADTLRASARPLDDFERVMLAMAEAALRGVAGIVRVVE